MKNKIVKNEKKQITIEALERRIYKNKIKNKDLTDVSNPDLVIEIVELLLRKPLATHEDFSKSARPFSRTLSLSRNLGLLNDRQLTNKARALIQHDNKLGRYSYLSILLEKSIVGQALLEWSGYSHLSSSLSSRIGEFLKQTIPSLSRDSRKRYARELSKLVSNLSPHHPQNKILKKDGHVAYKKIVDEDPHFENSIIDVIDRHKKGTQLLRISTGFMSAQGYDLVAKNLENTEIKILLGKDDKRGRKILTNPLNSFGDSVINGIPSLSKKGAHRRLYRELVEGSCRIKKVEPRMIENLHGKGFFGDLNWALPTSANLSRAGLERNIETGISTSKTESVEYFVEKFEGYWEEAEDITTEIIDEIVESWIFQPPVSPYLGYIRGLTEIYGNHIIDNIGKKYELASFQKMVVGSTIRSLKDRNAALLISPTGTGKTVMGSYIMAAMKKKYTKTVVIIPSNDLKDKWNNDCLSFGIFPMTITHRKLQLEMSEFQNTKEGIDLSMYIDENTLIVVDEAHKFRTQGTKGNVVLNSILNGDFNGSKPGILLLTATPIGIGFENLKNLYDLLNLGDSPEKLSDLEDYPAFINITLPFIMDRFGKDDGNGNRCLFFGDMKKYYASRHQRIVPFDDKNSQIYQMIKELDFRELRNEISLDNFGIDIEPATVDNMSTFNKIGLPSAVGSSKEAALERIDNLLEGIKQRNYVDSQKIRSQLLKLKEKIDSERKDDIYDITLKILNENQDKKIIINVVHVKTREALVRKIHRDTGRKLAEYEGTASEKKKLREKFAPVANDKKIPKRNQLEILIASGGASEGHDLQDAEIIINFDSWWTPLMLQQRMGRLDRPTDKPRSFSVYNLVNANSDYVECVTMDEKLRARANQLKGIIADGSYEAIEVRDWDSKTSRELGIITVDDLEETGIEMITTSRHIEDLADATDLDIRAARNLPLGFITASKGDNTGTFVMLKVKSEIYTGFLHEDNMISFAPGDQNYEKLLGYIRVEKNDLGVEVPEEHLKSVEKLVTSICKKHRLLESDVKLIFSSSME